MQCVYLLIKAFCQTDVVDLHINSEYININIFLFQLRYWINGDDIRTATDVTVGKDTEAVIYGIQKDLLYNLRVLGYSRGGDGNKGNTIYFTLGKKN